VLSTGVVIEPDASVSDSIVMEGSVVQRGATLRKTIVDRNVVIPAGASIGIDRDHDRRRFTVTPEGIVVVPGGIFVENS
jgi:glucose-1-phosphate adenylyltransferase